MKALVFLTVGCLAHFREMLEDALVSEFTEAHDELLAKFVGSFSGLHFPKMFVCFRTRSPGAGIIGSQGESQGLYILPSLLS